MDASSRSLLNHAPMWAPSCNCCTRCLCKRPQSCTTCPQSTLPPPICSPDPCPHMWLKSRGGQNTACWEDLAHQLILSGLQASGAGGGTAQQALGKPHLGPGLCWRVVQEQVVVLAPASAGAVGDAWRKQPCLHANTPQCGK